MDNNNYKTYLIFEYEEHIIVLEMCLISDQTKEESNTV